MKITTLILVMLALVSGLSAPAYAQEEGATLTARKHFFRGRQAFTDGNYAEAQAAFTRAYEISRKPELLWNMAEAARAGKREQEALRLYARYLEEAPANSPQRAQAREWIETLSSKREASKPPAHEGTVTPAPPSTRTEWTSLPATHDPKSGASSRPITQRWWFWAGTGAVVVGVVGAVLLTSRSSTSSGRGESSPPAGVVVDWR